MDQKVKAFAVAALRRASYRWPGRYNAKKRAKVSYGKYKCEMCGKINKPSLMNLDHKVPVVPISGWVSFDSFIERLFVPESGFQYICEDPCHLEKTFLETGKRVKARRKKKKK